MVVLVMFPQSDQNSITCRLTTFCSTHSHCPQAKARKRSKVKTQLPYLISRTRKIPPQEVLSQLQVKLQNQIKKPRLVSFRLATSSSIFWPQCGHSMLISLSSPHPGHPWHCLGPCLLTHFCLYTLALWQLPPIYLANWVMFSPHLFHRSENGDLTFSKSDIAGKRV